MASVNICPKTETDVLIASRRLGCNNHTNDRDPYMCIPNKEKTSLVEFCYNSVMGIHEKGNCLEASVGMVTEYSCKNFSYGCPDKSFFKDELYKYPACQDINTKYQCYVMDPSCPGHSNYESTVNYETIIYACAIAGGIAIPIIIFGVILLVSFKRRNREHSGDENKHQHPTTRTGSSGLPLDARDRSEVQPLKNIEENKVETTVEKSGEDVPQSTKGDEKEENETKQPSTKKDGKKDTNPTSTNRSRCTGCVPCCQNREADVIISVS